MKIGFIGLGQMGRGMALRLMERGHALHVWNRSNAAAQALGAGGAIVACSPNDLVDATDTVITMLADDVAVREVWMESGLVERMRAGALHVNMASVSPGLAREIEKRHAAQGTRYVSAPVFGRPEAAANGELDIVAAGPPQALAHCTPVFEALGRRWFDLGPSAEHANVVKIARNFLLATIIEGLGEAFALVQKSGVDAARFHEIITTTSMNAPAYKNYGRLMLEPPDRPTFPLKLGLKDVELALDAAHEAGMRLPTAQLIREQHLKAIARGYGDKDWAALGNYIAEAAGI